MQYISVNLARIPDSYEHDPAPHLEELEAANLARTTNALYSNISFIEGRFSLKAETVDE